jgi:hypothetical protein
MDEMVAKVNGVVDSMRAPSAWRMLMLPLPVAAGVVNGYSVLFVVPRAAVMSTEPTIT